MAHKSKVFLGYSFKIDRPKGYVKKWPGGKSFTYPCDYGYFPKYLGEDGEGLDAFVGDDPDGTFESFLKLKPGDDGKMVPDETKFLIGVSDADKKKIYALYGSKEMRERKTFSGMKDAMKAADEFKGKQRFAKKAEITDQLKADIETLVAGRSEAPVLTELRGPEDERHRNRVLGLLHAARMFGLASPAPAIDQEKVAVARWKEQLSTMGKPDMLSGLRKQPPIPNAQRDFMGLLSGVRNDSMLVPPKLAHRANPFGKVQGPDWLQQDEDHEFDASPEFWGKEHGG